MTELFLLLLFIRYPILMSPSSTTILTLLLLGSSAFAAVPATSPTTTTQTFAHLAQGLWQGEATLTVTKGDTLSSLAGRYATTPDEVAMLNNIKTTSKLKLGQSIHIKYAHLIPADLPDGITVNLPQRLLFLRQAGALNGVYALGLGKPSWPTPVGTWTIVNKQEGKTWIVPKSIQAEMAREGKAVKTHVPPGPDNPLGKYWLGLSLSGYGIHGTVAPSSIYHFQSHGCMRMYADYIEELFAKVDKGVTGSNNYWPILLEIQANGHILLEVHADVYNRHVNGTAELQQLADSQKASAKIDWTRAQSALKAASGMPVDITLMAANPK